MPDSNGRADRRFNRWVTLVIVIAWLGLLGFLLKENYMPRSSELSEALKIAPVESDDWFLIRIKGAYAGFGRSRQFKKGDNWVLLDDLRISLNLQGSVKPIKMVNESEVDSNFQLVSFSLKVATGIISFDQSGRMDGNTLVLEIPKIQGGGIKKIKLAEKRRMPRSLGLPLPLTGLKVGDKIPIPVFDPVQGNMSDARVDVQEKTDMVISGNKIEAWKVKVTYGNLDLNMWVDAQGKLIKGIMPMGLTVIRSDRSEIARELSSSRELPDVLSLTAVPVEDTVPDPVSLRTLKIEVLSGRETQIPSDDFRQKYSDGIITITKERLPLATYALPCTDRAMELELASSRFIRSDHPDIIKKAKEVIGNEKDPVKAGMLITEWVYKNVKKVPTPSVPDAFTVLQTMQGDCNEHAVLAAALARAVGLPSRMVVGLVYVNEGFYYHAWVNYWAGKSWFSADPLLNDVPTDPSHIALLFGDIDKHVNVISFLGRLKFKILAAE